MTGLSKRYTVLFQGMLPAAQHEGVNHRPQLDETLETENIWWFPEIEDPLSDSLRCLRCLRPGRPRKSGRSGFSRAQFCKTSPRNIPKHLQRFSHSEP